MDYSSIIDQELENKLLKSLFSYPKIVDLVINEFKPDYFSTALKYNLYRGIINFYTQANCHPSADHLKLYFDDIYSNDPDQNNAIQQLISIIDAYAVPHWNWIVFKLRELLKTIALQKSLYEASVKLKEGQVGDCEKIMANVLRQSFLSESDHTHALSIDPDQLDQYAITNNAFCCPTRIHALDKMISGLYRKELFIIMAPLNVGKSWAVLDVAYSALFSGKRVLYLTLEMSKDRVVQRFLQKTAGLYVPKNKKDLSKSIESWNLDRTEKRSTNVKSLLNKDDLIRSLKMFNTKVLGSGGFLSINEYPSGVATLSDITNELLMFDVKCNGLPDVLIVDGLLDIRIDSRYSDSSKKDNYRLSLADVTRGLREIAAKHQIAVLTTHQANRDAMKSETVEAHHVGESLGILQIADTAISLSQSTAEQETGIMRIKVVRSRNDRKWGEVKIWQNLALGQFALGSEIIPFETTTQSKPNSDIYKKPTL